jgi:raffinose/stachyose/melibiose transport system substrate-binding protein
MFKTITSLSLSAVLLLPLLSACAGDRSATAPSSSDPAQEEVAQEEVTINYLTWRANPDTNYPQVLIDKFNEQYPYIHVTADTGTTTTEEYLSTQKARFLSGQDIDVTTIRAESIAAYADAGYLTDLSDQPFLNNFSDSALEVVKYNGKVYTAPSAQNIAGVYYNKDIFATLGIEAPDNWEEFLDTAQKLKDADIAPLGNGWKDVWPIGFDIFPFIERIYAADTEIFDKINRGEVKYTDAVWVDAIEDIRDFIQRGYYDKNVLALSDTAAITNFRQGRTAMLIQGEFTMVSLSGENAVDFDLGVFKIPYNREGEDAPVPVSYYSSEAVAAASKHREAALTFVEFLSSPEGAAIVTENLAAFSPVKGSPSDFNPLAGLWTPLLTQPAVDFYHSRMDSGALAELEKGVQLLFEDKITPGEIAANVQAVQDAK